MKIGLTLATLFALMIVATGLRNAELNAKAQQPSPSLTHVWHVTSGFPGAPGGRGLVVTASEETNTAMMHANFAAGDLTDLEYMQTHVRHVLHALDLKESDQGPGLGFGVRQALEAAVAHTENAMSAQDASDALRMNGERLIESARGVLARVDQMTQIGNRVLAAGTALEAAPLVAELRDLALQLDTGSGAGPAGRNGMNHVEDEAYSILIGEGELRILQ